MGGKGDEKKLEQAPVAPTQSVEQKGNATQEAREAAVVSVDLSKLQKLHTEVALHDERHEIADLGESITSTCESQALALVDAVEHATPYEKIPVEQREWFDTFVGWNVVGSLHRDLLKQAKKTDGTVDVIKYHALRDQVLQPAAYMTTLGHETSFSPAELRVAKLLQGDGVFAKTYREKRLADVVKTMNTFVDTLLPEYNTEVLAHPEKAIDAQNTVSATPTGQVKVIDELKKAGEQVKDFVVDHKKPILIGTGIVAGVWILKKLFAAKRKHHSEDNADGANEHTSHHKESSLQDQIITWAKRLGLGAAGYYVVHGLMTGKWKPGDLLNWDKTAALEDPKKNVNNYEKQTTPEQKVMFEGLGTATDTLYTNFFSTELASGWQDNADMETMAQQAGKEGKNLKGVVPRCLSSEHSSVDSLLSAREEAMSFLSSSINEIKEKAYGAITGSGAALWEFLKQGFGAKGDPKEAFNTWYEEKPAEKAKQIQFYYREKVRVQTFLLQREQALITKITEEKCKTAQPVKNIEEAMDDEKWLKDNVMADPRYASFRSGTVEAAFTTLQSMGLMTGDMDDDTKATIKELDEHRQKFLDYDGKETILERARADLADGKLEAKNQQQLIAMCNEMSKEMQGGVLDAAKESAWNVYKDLFNGDEAAKREFLQKSGLDAWALHLQSGLGSIITKLQQGTITSAEYEGLVDAINSYTALKKEMEVGTNTVQVINNADGSSTATHFLGGLMNNLITAVKKSITGDFDEAGEYIVATGVTVAAGGVGVLIVKKYGKDMVKGAGKMVWNGIAKMPSRVLTPGSRLATTKAAHMLNLEKMGITLRGPVWALRRRFFAGPDGPEKLMKYVREERISFAKAQEIVEYVSGKGNKYTVMQNMFLGETTRANWERVVGADVDGFTRKFLEAEYAANDAHHLLADKKVLAAVGKHFQSGPFMKKILDAGKYDDALLFLEDMNKASTTPAKKALIDACMKHENMTMDALESLRLHIHTLDEAMLKSMTSMDDAVAAIIHDPKVLETPAAFNALVQHITTPANIPSLTVSPKPQVNSIVDDIVELEKKISPEAKPLLHKAAQQVDDLTTIEKTLLVRGDKSAEVVRSQIAGLESFARNLKHIPPAEVKELVALTAHMPLKTIALLSEEGCHVGDLLKAVSKESVITDDVLKLLLKSHGGEELLTKVEGTAGRSTLVADMEKFAMKSKTVVIAEETFIKLSGWFIKAVKIAA